MAINTLGGSSTTLTQKVQTFTSTGTFTVPANCTTVEVFLVGGGGGGGACSNAVNNSNGGGGGGGGVVRKAITVTPSTG